MKENKVFLGGTCANSTWREELMPKLLIDYFNPVVDDWTPECQLEEERQKLICAWQLYVITPLMQGVFSIAEVVDGSNKDPDHTIFCVLPSDIKITEVIDYPSMKKREVKEVLTFTRGEMKSLDATKNLVRKNGAIVLDTLDDIAEYLNSTILKN